jgi:hypothetical protein
MIRIEDPIKAGRGLPDTGVCRFQALRTVEVRSDLTRLTGKAEEPLELRISKPVEPVWHWKKEYAPGRRRWVSWG